MLTADDAVLLKFRRFLEAEGLDIARTGEPGIGAVFAAARPGGRSDAAALVEALQILARVCGRPDLGLAFGRFDDPRSFGPLSALSDRFETLGQAVRAGLDYMRLENEAVVTALEHDGDGEVAVLAFPVAPGRFGAARFIEGMLALSVETMRLFLGPTWKPLRVEFAHAPPPDLLPWRRAFGVTPRFLAGRNALVLNEKDLDRKAPRPDAVTRQAEEVRFRRLLADLPQPVTARCEQSLLGRLGRAPATLTDVAADLGLHPRALQRRLRQEGKAFGEVLERLRQRIADDYLAGTDLPVLVDLAARLGLGDASAASRFLRTRMGRGLRRLALEGNGPLLSQG